MKKFFIVILLLLFFSFGFFSSSVPDFFYPQRAEAQWAVADAPKFAQDALENIRKTAVDAKDFALKVKQYQQMIKDYVEFARQTTELVQSTKTLGGIACYAEKNLGVNVRGILGQYGLGGTTEVADKILGGAGVKDVLCDQVGGCIGSGGILSGGLSAIYEPGDLMERVIDKYGVQIPSAALEKMAGLGIIDKQEVLRKFAGKQCPCGRSAVDKSAIQPVPGDPTFVGPVLGVNTERSVLAETDECGDAIKKPATQPGSCYDPNKKTIFEKAEDDKNKIQNDLNKKNAAPKPGDPDFVGPVPENPEDREPTFNVLGVSTGSVLAATDEELGKVQDFVNSWGEQRGMIFTREEIKSFIDKGLITPSDIQTIVDGSRGPYTAEDIARFKAALGVTNSGTSPANCKKAVPPVSRDDMMKIMWVLKQQGRDIPLEQVVKMIDIGVLDPETTLKLYVKPNEKLESLPDAPLPECAEWAANGSCLKMRTSIRFPRMGQGFSVSADSQQLGTFEIRTNPAEFILGIFIYMLSFVGGIALLLIMVSGYKIMTSAGKPEAIQEGREQLIAAIVGLLFIILSFVIFQLITLDLLRLPGLVK